MECPYCHREDHQVRAGFSASGSQRYKCQACQRKYIPQRRKAGYPTEVRMKAVQYHLKGIGFRGIGRILKVNHQSVVNWIDAYSADASATAERRE